MVQARRVTSKVQSSLWFIPVLCVLIGAALSFSSIAIDEATNYDLVPSSLTGGPDAALQILSTIAASMVSLAALVLTITMVVVQLAMGQFSPRIVQTFLRDKPSQIAVGLFIATFVHAMLTLREVRFGERRSVPGLSIVVAYVLVVISVVVLVLYIHHIGRSLRVSALIELVGSDTRTLLDREYPANRAQPRPRRRARHRRIEVGRGHVHRARPARRARRRPPTASCGWSRPSAHSSPPARRSSASTAIPTALDADDLVKRVRLGMERTLDQDVAYGLRMLVDMAERSLADSPFLDPTTAVQAIDRLHDCLRQIAQRELPDGRYRDERGPRAPDRPGDGLGRVPPPRLRRDQDRRCSVAPGQPSADRRAAGPGDGRVRGSAGGGPLPPGAPVRCDERRGHRFG